MRPLSIPFRPILWPQSATRMLGQTFPSASLIRAANAWTPWFFPSICSWAKITVWLACWKECSIVRTYSGIDGWLPHQGSKYKKGNEQRFPKKKKTKKKKEKNLLWQRPRSSTFGLIRMECLWWIPLCLSHRWLPFQFLEPSHQK